MNKGISGSIIGVAVLVVYYFFFSGSGAVKYNDRIIDNQNEIVDEFENFFNVLDGENVGEMRMALANLKMKIDEAIRDVSSMSDYKDDTEFRDKGIELFEFYNVVASEDCSELIDIFQRGVAGLTDYDRERIDEVINNFENDENAHLDELDAIQKRFAQKHNFKVERRR